MAILFKEPRKTYRVSGNLVAAAGTFPFLVIAGSSRRVLRLTRIKIHGPMLTTAAYQRIAVQKLSALPTGGTGTNPTKVPMDSNSPASNATITAYTVAPTAGTVVGQIAERTVLAQSTTPAANAALDECEFIFSADSDNIEFPIARIATQGFAVLFPAAPATAVTFSYTIEYTEDGN